MIGCLVCGTVAVGINSHLLPGDMVATTAHPTWLRSVHPDELLSPTAYVDSELLVCGVGEGTGCIIIGMAAAGSAGGGHAFFVMTNNDGRFGWLYNYEVRPIVTLREPCAK
jgi:hypothetical protein